MTEQKIKQIDIAKFLKELAELLKKYNMNLYKIDLSVEKALIDIKLTITKPDYQIIVIHKDVLKELEKRYEEMTEQP